MKRPLYFQANKDIEGPNGAPVEIGGVKCRFQAGRYYEIAQFPSNRGLIASLEVMIENQDLKRLTTAAGMEKVDKQTEADRAAKKLRNTGANAPASRPSARVE
jgi:hypothetical protein